MKTVREIFASFPPVKKGGNIAQLEYNEIMIPHRLKRFQIDLSSIAGALRPVREMANAISEEIARGNPTPNRPTPI